MATKPTSKPSTRQSTDVPAGDSVQIVVPFRSGAITVTYGAGGSKTYTINDSRVAVEAVNADRFTSAVAGARLDRTEHQT